ncbi:MAG: hypothetical protein J6A77_06370 [Lachnospiraceae bacterium]|nr:hypothetical protein [Lachnospiraceae bacterium]
MEEKKKSNKGPLLVAAILGVLLIVCVVLLVVRLTGRVEDYATAKQEQKQEEQQRREEEKKQQKEAEREEEEKKKEAQQKEAEQEETKEKPGKLDAKATATPEPEKEETPAPKENVDSRYTLKKVPYSVILMLHDDAFIVWDNSKYGLVDGNGDYLLRPAYPYVEYYDEEWVTFSDSNDVCYVYDTEGKLLFTYDLWQSGFTSEDGIAYSVWTCYKKGMRTEMIIADGDEEYYGIRYYNAETGNLIYEAVGDYEDIAVGSIPDENGMAAVIKNAPYEILIYRVTKDGYEEDSYNYFDVDVRNFYWSNFVDWRDNTMSEGWLRTTLEESTNSMLGTETEWMECLFDVVKGVRAYLPEKYQNVYADFYGDAKGDYYGIATLTEEQYFSETSEVVYYAVCHGGSVLTEEIYTWMSFEENYIIAGDDGENSFVHILDYKGNVLKEFKDAANNFWKGKLVVDTGEGVYLLDENLEICSECLAEEVEFCQTGFLWKDRAGYMILEK